MIYWESDFIKYECDSMGMRLVNKQYGVTARGSAMKSDRLTLNSARPTYLNIGSIATCLVPTPLHIIFNVPFSAYCSKIYDAVQRAYIQTSFSIYIYTRKIYHRNLCI